VEGNLSSANAYDSLAEGYAKAGMWKKAAGASEKAVALATEFDLPNRADFVEQTEKLSGRLKQDSAISHEP